MIERRRQDRRERQAVSQIGAARWRIRRRRIADPAHQGASETDLQGPALQRRSDIVKSINGRARRRQDEDRQGRDDLGEDHSRGHQGHDLKRERRAR